MTTDYPTTSTRTGTLYWLGVLLHDPTLDPTAKLLMVGLADHVDARDECYVGIGTLAGYAGVSYGTARRRLAALVAAGRLDRARLRRMDGNLSTYSWRLVREEPAVDVSGGEPRPARNLRGDQRAPRRAVTSARLGARAEPPSVEPPSTKKTLVASEDATTECADTPSASFDDFWQVWLTVGRGSKAEARAAWPAAVKAAGGDPAVIVAGARRYVTDPNLPEPQFIPHARRWLRGQRWCDPPLPPRAATNGRPAPAPIDTDRLAPAGRIHL